MKLQILGVSLLASTALVSGITGADAKSTQPGLYLINGGQELCLQSAGTWYSPTFSGWGGTWAVVNGKIAKTIIRGNYASGAGNDSISVKGKIAAWDEWRDSESYSYYADPVPFSYLGTCTDARVLKPNHVNKSNPSQ
jgi:hypothetical protein